MRIFLLVINLLFLSGCNSTPKNSNSKNANENYKPRQTIISNKVNDSLLLNFAITFTASTINLNKSLSFHLDSFLLNIDTNHLRQQKEFRVFVSIILAKLYLYHLNCCNQGYDLQSMETGGAKVIIEEFKRMAGYSNKGLEMLNSGVIVDFIKSDQTLNDNLELKELLKKIEIKTHLINDGNL